MAQRNVWQCHDEEFSGIVRVLRHEVRPPAYGFNVKNLPQSTLNRIRLKIDLDIQVLLRGPIGGAIG